MANTQAVARFRLGNLYEKTGRKELARTEYEKALNLNPKYEETQKALNGVTN